MSVTITAPLAAATNPAASLAAGGSLTVGTAYYYRVIAVARFSNLSAPSGYVWGLYYSGNWGIPCDEVTATPTSGNQSIALTWDAVTGADGYVVYRTLVSGDYAETTAHHIDNKTSFFRAITNTNSFTDDGTYSLRKALFLPNGLPVATISSSTEGSPDTEETIYAALVAAGFGTTHCSKVSDLTGVYGLSYWLHCTIIINGWLRIQKGRQVLHEGTFIIGNGAYGMTLGEKTTNATYRGASYYRKFIYQGVNGYTTTTIKIYNSHFYDLAATISDFSTDTYVCYIASIEYRGLLYIENSVIDSGIQMFDSVSGYAKNSILLFASQSSGKFFIDSCIYNRVERVCYVYYATQNPLLTNVKPYKQTNDIYYIKDANVVTMSAINHQWKTDPPTAGASTNPANLSVLRRVECDLKIVDSTGEAIQNATVIITDGLSNVITPELSLSTGDVYFTSGTATAGAASTLTDSGKAWGTNTLNDYLIEIYQGTGSGQTRSILSNTGTVITIKGTWDTNPSTDSKYRVKILLNKNLYVGKAASPYYDTTTYTPYTITIEAGGYRTRTEPLEIQTIPVVKDAVTSYRDLPISRGFMLAALTDPVDLSADALEAVATEVWSKLLADTVPDDSYGSKVKNAPQLSLFKRTV
jgi:hypothetical protein